MDTILSFMIMFSFGVVICIKVCIAVDSISVSQSISDGNTLVSQGGTFELGFFSPGNSSKRYLGIWYKNIKDQTVVWVANRANPINGSSSGILTLNSYGNLVLSQTSTVIWHTTIQKQARNPVVVLMDSGNLVVRNDKGEDYLWQSFDYPTDTLLPGMKLGWNLQSFMEWRVTSWSSPNDPSPGNVSWGLKLHSYPEIYLTDGSFHVSRIGPWNGLYFSAIPDEPSPSYDFNFVTKNDYNYPTNKYEMFYTYSVLNKSTITRIRISSDSYLQVYEWLEDRQHWTVYGIFPRALCDTYNPCGTYGYCRISESSAVCHCLKGFGPKSPEAWNLRDWTQGCVRDKPLNCNDSVAFVKFEGLKVPDTTETWLDENIDLDLCRVKCLKNCSCTAYTNSDIRGAGSGCVMWFGDLLDLRQFEQGGQDLYIRMAASELEPRTVRKKSKRTIIAVTIPIFSGMLLISLYFIHRALTNNAGKSKTEDNIETQVDVLDLPLFDLRTIIAATNNFLIENKIGEGGFGLVYKGKLMDGQEIAVKRLSRSSGQGITEFINEVKLIAKLHHRNLVRLLGCCIQGQERLLVYEYMANGSLDSFIYDHTKGKLLQWPQRLHIIFGIARGLLYLHQDSRLRIIHRDLKTSNVLLDDELNPKISDFGIAKAFGGDQTEGKTKRVVGTYGYMAPEYVIGGLFSIKSDVFSFGVLLLEVLSGNKNRALYEATHTVNLVGYAWTLWKDGKALQLIDSNIRDSCIASEVLRCIHVSLLCVQQYPKDRPSMNLVLRMLENHMELVEPKEPSFFPRKASSEEESSSIQFKTSTNELTISSFTGR